MTTTTPTLTDRYVWAAARTLPEAQREEFARELRERIGDEVDARRGAGAATTDAERAALVELGDPAALAATYVDRPLQLIGPRYYLTWKRLVTTLFAVVLPIALVAIVLAQVLGGADVAQVFASVLGTAIPLAIQLAFWPTLVFALIERSPRSTPAPTWTPDHLPQVRDQARAGRLGDLIASVVFLSIFAGLIVWQQTASPFVDEAGEPIPFLNPDLWSFWIPWFLVLLALEVLFAAAIYAWGWNWWLVVANLLLNLAFAVPALWLFATGRLVNPEYLAEIGWPWGDAGGTVTAIIVVVFVAVTVWDVIDGVVKTVKGRGGSALAIGRI
ncbi:permease prefix domain 1-containing protein [Agromyces tropicus]|uniref:Permease prefix domain 1-containing protein n=1 Tax=Agromyces tropicus TaxID=555371 RepID=A0ABP5GFP3_9MICO